MPDPLRRPRVLALLAALLATTPAAAQDPAERQAEQMLGAARKAYNDGNARFAADTFAEYLKKHSGQKGGHAARLGLGLALLDLPERDYRKAAETLGPPANEAAFADRPLALYYLGVCQRGLGLKAAREAAHGPFAEAARSFGLAREAFDKRAADGDAEWAARARCDLADVELRLNRPKEARAAVEPFVADAALAAVKSRPLGLYYHGFACFLLNDIPAAGKSLGLVATLDQPFAPHARYLLGRVHQAEGENAEAAAAFDAVIAGYEKQKKAAVEALQHPERFKNDPWEKARLEALRTEPPPEYVVGATFHGACLNYEAGRFGEALPKFQAFAKDFAASPLAPDALLRAGFCLVQMKQYDEAAKLLRPLADQHKRLADQALYWLGKAQLGQAQAADPGKRKELTQTAVATLRSAADRAAGLAGQDPAAKERRTAIAVETADALMAGGQYREAADAYQHVWAENQPPGRTEEVLARVVAAYQLAGDHAAAVAKGTQFKQRFPRSPLLPEVLFREAEALHDRARGLAKAKDAAGKDAFAKAAARYEELVAKYPEFERVNRARYALALCHAEADDWEKAAGVLETIPAADRTGEAAAAVLLLADALIRTAPAKADDALQDNMLREKLGNAIALLEGFAAANAKAPEAAEALLKLGYCYKRLGIQLADPKDKNEAFNKARAALDRVRKEFPAAAAAGPATLERAKLRILQGDRNGAVEELRPFTQDPLRQSSAAPLALVTLATLLRERNQAATAVALLKDAQTRYDAVLAQDPRRAEWVKLLRYHYGVALLDAGQPVEARQVLEPLAGTNVGSQIGAEAALKSEAALAADMRRRWDELEKERNKPGRTAAQLDDVTRRGKGLTREYVEHVRHMVRRADSLPAAPAAAEARARMYYEAAWLFRSLAPFAPLNPQARPQTDADRAAKDGLTQELLDGARGAYAKLVAAFPDAALAVDARFELAELEADAGRADEAVRLLKEALDKEPADRPTPPEAAERMRLRLGAALFDRKDYDAARGQFDAVAANAKSPLRGQALYRAAECLFAQGKAEEAKAALKPFRDDPAFQKLDGLTDRALLRLGHAYAAAKNWESSRVVLELLLNRFGHGPWAADARYGVGVALQGLNRLDEAVGQFAQVTALKADELAGRAHLQIGLCRLAQKKYGEAVKAFQTVSYGYDAPDLRFAAMLEEARALAEDKKPNEAAKLLEKVARDAPDGSEWFKAAKERLGKK